MVGSSPSGAARGSAGGCREVDGSTSPLGPWVCGGVPGSSTCGGADRRSGSGRRGDPAFDDSGVGGRARGLGAPSRRRLGVGAGLGALLDLRGAGLEPEGEVAVLGRRPPRLAGRRRCASTKSEVGEAAAGPLGRWRRRCARTSAARAGSSGIVSGARCRPTPRRPPRAPRRSTAGSRRGGRGRSTPGRGSSTPSRRGCTSSVTPSCCRSRRSRRSSGAEPSSLRMAPIGVVRVGEAEVVRRLVDRRVGERAVEEHVRVGEDEGLVLVGAVPLRDVVDRVQEAPRHAARGWWRCRRRPAAPRRSGPGTTTWMVGTVVAHAPAAQEALGLRVDVVHHRLGVHRHGRRAGDVVAVLTWPGRARPGRRRTRGARRTRSGTGNRTSPSNSKYGRQRPQPVEGGLLVVEQLEVASEYTRRRSRATRCRTGRTDRCPVAARTGTSGRSGS